MEKVFKKNEILSREEMKSIVGGGCGSCSNPDGSSGSYGCYCQSGGPTNGTCRCLWQQNNSQCSSSPCGGPEQ